MLIATRNLVAGNEWNLNLIHVNFIVLNLNEMKLSHFRSYHTSTWVTIWQTQEDFVFYLEQAG